MPAQDIGDALPSYDKKAFTPAFVKTLHTKAYPAIDPTQPALSAKGKTVFITGGATGIGFSTARSFAAAGASTVVIAARRAAVLDEASAKLTKEFPSVQILTYVTDLTDSASTSSALNSAVKASSTHGIDILVTSAYYPFNQALSLDSPEHDYRGSFETNLLGNFNLTKAFISLPSSPNAGKKILLDISSEAAFSPFPTTGIYGATKYAWTFISRHLQNDYPDKLRVHSYHPGTIFTPALASFGIPKDAIEHMLDDESLPGQFAVWLASDQAEFLKGRYLLAKWDVEDILKNRDVFEKDPTFSTLTLKI